MIRIIIGKLKKSDYLKLIDKFLSVKFHLFIFSFEYEDNYCEILESYSMKELKKMFPKKICDNYFYGIQKM